MDKLTDSFRDLQVVDSGVEDGSVATTSMVDERKQEAAETREKLLALYDELKETEFTGTYRGLLKLPVENSMGKKHIIEVSSESEYSKELEEIIKQDPKDDVWKGLTGPPGYINYWLWAEKILAEEIETDKEVDLEFLEERCFKLQKTYVKFENTDLYPGGLIKLYFTTKTDQ